MDRVIALIAVSLCTASFVTDVNAQDMKHNTEARVITRDHNPTFRLTLTAMMPASSQATTHRASVTAATASSTFASTVE